MRLRSYILSVFACQQQIYSYVVCINAMVITVEGYIKHKYIIIIMCVRIPVKPADSYNKSQVSRKTNIKKTAIGESIISLLNPCVL